MMKKRIKHGRFFVRGVWRTFSAPNRKKKMIMLAVT